MAVLVGYTNRAMEGVIGWSGGASGGAIDRGVGENIQFLGILSWEDTEY